MFDWLKRKPVEPEAITKPRKDALCFKVGGFWGDSIKFQGYQTDSEKQHVVGWKTPRPVVGDILIADMESGKTGVWVFQKIEYCNDPRDMFFADVLAQGHSDDPELGFVVPPVSRTNPLGMLRV